MKLATKILLAIGTFLAGLLTLPGVNDYIVAFVGALVAAHPKLAILSVIVTFLLGLVHQPAKPQASPLAGSVNYSQKSALAMILCIGLAVLPLGGCTANYQTASNVYNGVNIAINLAQSEAPLLVTVGAISQADETVIANYLTLAGTLNTNYKSCIDNAQNATLSTASKFVDCLGVFATGLSSPTALSAFHVVSAKGQSKAQAYIGVVVAAVNLGLAAFHAPTAAVPVVAPATAETKADSDVFQARVIEHLPLRLRLASGL